jgi:hypothetical protein
MTEDMIEDIINSKLAPAEKLFLVTEWMLRDHAPYELLDLKLSDIQGGVKSFVARRLPSGFLKNALGQVKSLLQIKNQRRLFPLMIGLAYYSYVDSEFVYEHEMRMEMMSKVSELGFELQEIEKFYEKWVNTIGDGEILFNKIFEK